MKTTKKTSTASGKSALAKAPRRHEATNRSEKDDEDTMEEILRTMIITAKTTRTKMIIIAEN